jgi:hypothetical protein
MAFDHISVLSSFVLCQSEQYLGLKLNTLHGSLLHLKCVQITFFEASGLMEFSFLQPFWHVEYFMFYLIELNMVFQYAYKLMCVCNSFACTKIQNFESLYCYFWGISLIFLLIQLQILSYK